MSQSLDHLVTAATSPGPHAGRAAGRLMTLMENQPHRLAELLQVMAGRFPAPRLLLGITGAPGSGKSTLVDRLVATWRVRDPKMRIGVVAVDPSSPYTGGAVLGDRVRLMRHANDPLVHVRSLASRGHLGGLSLGVKGIVRVMGLIGCEVVLIETVGVGQSEVEVTQVADQVMVVMAPGQGDSIQLLKAGLMEVGDWFVINKADLPNAQAFHAAVVAAIEMDRQVEHDLAMLERNESKPDASRVLLVSARENQGVDALVDQLEHRLSQNGSLQQNRRAEREHDDVRHALLEMIRQQLLDTMQASPTQDDLVRQVLSGDLTVEAAANQLVQRLSAGRMDDEPADEG